MSLCWLEIKRVCKSASYIAAVAVLVLFAYFQDVLPPPELISAPGVQVENDLARHVVAAEDYALIRDVDRFSGAHARLFARRIGSVLAVLCGVMTAGLIMGAASAGLLGALGMIFA